MEKLVLRGIMWGADKIPDGWFDKIPGGFYKSTNADAPADSSRHGHSHSQSDDEYLKSQRRTKERRRRRSQAHHRRTDSVHHTSSLSHDSDLSDSEHRSRAHRHSDMRRNADYERYGDEDSARRTPRDRRKQDGPDMAAQPPYPDFPDAQPYDATPSGETAGTAAADLRGGMYSPPPSAASSAPKAGYAAGYVPYADIYGNPACRAAPMSPPDSLASARLDAHPVSPPPRVGDHAYHQDPYAQESGSGAHAAYVTDNHPTSSHRRVEDDQYHDRYDDRSDLDSRDDYPSDRIGSRSPRRNFLRSESPSTASYYDRDGRRRARSERRQPEKGSSVARAKSRLRETFDTSEGGIGYGAIGALAGGLLGDEIGGIIPTALGAAVGALGGSAFHKREKKREQSRRSARYAPNDDYDDQRRRRHERSESRYYSD